jgi:hypothetical protein
MKRRSPVSYLRLGTLLMLFGLGLPFACDALDDSDGSMTGGTGGSRPFSVDGGAIRPDGTPMDGKGILPPFATDGGSVLPPSPADGSPAPHGDGAFMDAGRLVPADDDAGEDDAGY